MQREVPLRALVAPGLAAVLAGALLAAGCRPEAREDAPSPSPPMERPASPASPEPRGPPPTPEPPPTSTAPERSRTAPAAAVPGDLPVEARAEGENWLLALEVPGSLRAGQPARARVRIAARGGMHVNEEYPTSFRPDPEAAASFAGERVPLAEVASRVSCAGEPSAACEVVLPLPFTPKEPGAWRFAGTVAFSVCDANRCLIEKVPLVAVARTR